MELMREIRNSQVANWKASNSSERNEDVLQVTKKKTRSQIATGFADSSESENEDWIVKTVNFGTPTQVPKKYIASLRPSTFAPSVGK